MNIDNILTVAVEAEFESAYRIFCSELRRIFPKPKLLLGTKHLIDFLRDRLKAVPARTVLNSRALYDDKTNSIIVTDHELRQDAVYRMFCFFHELGHVLHANLNPFLCSSNFYKLHDSTILADQTRGIIYSAVSEGMAQYLAISLSLQHGDMQLRRVAFSEHRAWSTAVSEFVLHGLKPLHDFDDRCRLGYQFVHQTDPILKELEKMILWPPETMEELRNPTAYRARLGI